MCFDFFEKCLIFVVVGVFFLLEGSDEVLVLFCSIIGILLVDDIEFYYWWLLVVGV